MLTNQLTVRQIHRKYREHRECYHIIKQEKEDILQTDLRHDHLQRWNKICVPRQGIKSFCQQKVLDNNSILIWGEIQATTMLSEMGIVRDLGILSAKM